MPKFNFVAMGSIPASTPSYASTDVIGALSKLPSIKDLVVVTTSEHPLCEGSEEPATHVNTANTPEAPYYQGKCSRCGTMVPLLAAGHFEVIKHFAPAAYAAHATKSVASNG